MSLRLITACVLWACPQFAPLASAATTAPQLQSLIRQATGTPAWSGGGYRLAGSFVFKGWPEECTYDAVFQRWPGAWQAEFKHIDATRTIRFGHNDEPWASTPELTAPLQNSQAPYCARYDFPALYAELLRILGERPPRCQIREAESLISITGTLGDGSKAVFVVAAADYFIRNVVIRPPEPAPPAWVVPYLGNESSSLLLTFPEGDRSYFEVWFSDPGTSSGFRHPRRTDFVASSGVIGSFFLVEISPAGFDAPPPRPSRLPWARNMAWQPAPGAGRSLLMQERDRAQFRARLEEQPWQTWSRINAVLALWAVAAVCIGPLFPAVPTWISLAVGVGLTLVGFVALLRRRIQEYRTVSPALVVAGLAVPCLVLVAGIASVQIHTSGPRSRLALQAAIRYESTGQGVYRWAAARLLDGIVPASGTRSVTDLARTCRAFAAAYDLISPSLTRSHQIQIEQSLFICAQPVYGASLGWRANTAEIGTIAAGLGLVGLAADYEPYVGAACAGIDRLLSSQLQQGFHPDGPGASLSAMGDAADFMFALKRARGIDFFERSEFQRYVESMLQLRSPIGTVPLIGAGDFDEAARVQGLLLKAASQCPAETAERCVTTFDRYWTQGQYNASGLRRKAAEIINPVRFVFHDPLVMLGFDRRCGARAGTGSSAILGNGQVAVLRSGDSSDALFMAVHARRPGSAPASRDILSFDLYAHGALLAHGPGGPGTAPPDSAPETAASNSITLNGASQAGTGTAGIAASLLNEPRFDFVRILADTAYSDGQVQRDVVLVRPDGAGPGYFILVDEVMAADLDTKVAWFLHGRGVLSTGVDRISRWRSPRFAPQFRSDNVVLAAYPLGSSIDRRSSAGRLSGSRSSVQSETLVLEWTGSRRLCTILLPTPVGEDEPEIAARGPASAQVGGSDWICLIEPGTRQAVGPISSSGEYVVARERHGSFPAILLVGGMEVSLGPHSVRSDKPLTLSLDGLNGSLLCARPETRVEIRSPEILESDLFQIDGVQVQAHMPGMLALSLETPGAHRFGRATNTRLRNRRNAAPRVPAES